MSNGWIKISYKLLDWEWYGDPNMVALFMHLLLRANYRPVRRKGDIFGRGVVVTSREELSRETGISERTIRTCITRLKSTNEITVKSSKQGSVITLTNYDKYQSSEMSGDQQTDQQTDQIVTNDRPTTDQRPTNSKEYKNINNIYNISSSNEDDVQLSEKTAEFPEKIPFETVKNDWNTICAAFPRLHVMSQARKNKIRSRIAEMGGVEKALPIIRLLFEKTAASGFLRGDNRSGWRASFDWLFQNDKNWVKVYEGNYDNNTTTQQEQTDNDGTTPITEQYSNPAFARQREFVRHITEKLATPDPPEPDLSGCY